MAVISVHELQQIMACPLSVAETWQPQFDRMMPDFGINTPKRAAAFFAQIAVESGGLRVFEENLNYSAVGLANTWPSRYAIDPQAKPRQPNELAREIARQPELIANYTYANRMGNRGPDSGDGWRFRGRGPKQITGRNNYTALDEEQQIGCLEDPDLLLFPKYGALSACWYWSKAGCSELADVGDFRRVTIAINGGLIGYPERVRYWEKAKLVLGVEDV